MSESPGVGEPYFDDDSHAIDPPAAVILPVPYDGTSTWRKGADRGPAAILEASRQVELWECETRTEPWRRGLRTRPAIEHAGDPESLADRVAEEVDRAIRAGAIPVVLGGEHSVSIGAIRAAADAVPGVGVLQVDAHADTRESYEGSTHNHACVMARARERCPISQVGLRAVDASELAALDESRVVWAHEIAADRGDGWIDRALAPLPEAVWVTIDLDGFDPSLLPATGTPEPGGLGWYEVARLIDRTVATRRVVGFDVVELCPAPGHHASAFVAAKLVYRFLGALDRAGRLGAG